MEMKRQLGQQHLYQTKETFKQRLQRRIFSMKKESIQQEDVMIINTYSLNIGAPRYTMQISTNKVKN